MTLHGKVALVVGLKGEGSAHSATAAVDLVRRAQTAHQRQAHLQKCRRWFNAGGYKSRGLSALMPHVAQKAPTVHNIFFPVHVFQGHAIRQAR